MQKHYFICIMQMLTVLVLTSDMDPQFLTTDADYISNNICTLLSVISCWTQKVKVSNILQTT